MHNYSFVKCPGILKHGNAWNKGKKGVATHEEQPISPVQQGLSAEDRERLLRIGEELGVDTSPYIAGDDEGYHAIGSR